MNYDEKRKQIVQEALQWLIDIQDNDPHYIELAMNHVADHIYAWTTAHIEGGNNE